MTLFLFLAVVYLAGFTVTAVAFLAYCWRDLHPSDLPTAMLIGLLWPTFAAAVALKYMDRGWKR